MMTFAVLVALFAAPPTPAAHAFEIRSGDAEMSMVVLDGKPASMKRSTADGALLGGLSLLATAAPDGQVTLRIDEILPDGTRRSLSETTLSIGGAVEMQRDGKTTTVTYTRTR